MVVVVICQYGNASPGDHTLCLYFFKRKAEFTAERALDYSAGDVGRSKIKQLVFERKFSFISILISRSPKTSCNYLPGRIADIKLCTVLSVSVDVLYAT